MSNKAIVFYTGELLEVQENSLREAHGVENIIFVPVESMDDLNTKILETTEQPFTVYNYLNDPDLIIAVCDKLSTLTAETGFLPEYFIWVEEIETSRREEIATEVFHSKPVDLNVSGSVAKQLIGRAKRLPITRVMNPESFMTSGIVLSDDVAYGMLFDDVPNCFIYTSSEKNLLSWFNTLIMNLAVSKREFPMLKAVIYAFEDERNQPMLGDDRDHQFVARHIVAALELFGKTKEVKIFKGSEIEEFKQYIALSEEEVIERDKLMAQASQPETLHVDVSGLEMPDSVNNVMHRLKAKGMTERPNPYLSYGEAIEMCKRGIDVACVNWRADEFLTVNSGAMVHADNFWSPGNKRMAMAKADKQLAVFPHFLRTSPFGTVPYVPDFNDMFSEWVVSADRVKVKRVTIRSEEGFLKLTLNYGLDTFATSEFELAPFWIVYDVLADMAPLVTVIGDNKVSNLPAIVGAMKNAHDQRQRYVSHTFTLDENGLIDDRDNYSPYVQHHVIDQLGVTIERIKEGAYKHVVVDTDSFKTESQLEKIKEALQEANVLWCSVSYKEQVFGISE